MQELRNSPKATGHDRIFVHGDIEKESFEKKMAEGIPVNEKTLDELKIIGESMDIDTSILIDLPRSY